VESTSVAFAQLCSTLHPSSPIEPMQDTTGMRVFFSAPDTNFSSMLIDVPTPSDNWKQYRQQYCYQTNVKPHTSSSEFLHDLKERSGKTKKFSEHINGQ